MPRDEDPLTPQQIEGLIEWIRMDAPWPEVAEDAQGEEGAAVLALRAGGAFSTIFPEYSAVSLFQSRTVNGR